MLKATRTTALILSLQALTSNVNGNQCKMQKTQILHENLSNDWVFLGDTKKSSCNYFIRRKETKPKRE